MRYNFDMQKKKKYRNKRNNLHSIFARMKHSKGILGESVRTFIYFCSFQKHCNFQRHKSRT